MNFWSRFAWQANLILAVRNFTFIEEVVEVDLFTFSLVLRRLCSGLAYSLLNLKGGSQARLCAHPYTDVGLLVRAILDRKLVLDLRATRVAV